MYIEDLDLSASKLSVIGIKQNVHIGESLNIMSYTII